jgi:8-oxo-dGTP pyrophosphatase MutT (NUDIX family)
MDFASVALVDPRGWILLQERDEHPVVDPEKWGFPGGAVEPGEGFAEAAHRELEEETGVRVDGGLTCFGEFDFACAVHGQERFALFTARVELTDDDVECHEGRQMVFVDPAVAVGLDLTASAAQVLPAFVRSEAYRGLTSGR